MSWRRGIRPERTLIGQCLSGNLWLRTLFLGLKGHFMVGVGLAVEMREPMRAGCPRRAAAIKLELELELELLKLK